MPDSSKVNSWFCMPSCSPLQRPRCFLKPSTSSDHNTLSPQVAEDLDALLALLVVADRFDIGVLTTACAGLLNSLQDKMTPSQAEGLVSLPFPIQALPGLRKAVVVARNTIREVHSPALKEKEYPKPFLGSQRQDFVSFWSQTRLQWRQKTRCSRQLMLGWVPRHPTQGSTWG